MTGSHSVGLLWKEHRFPFNRDLAIMRLKSLEDKFKKDPEFHKTCKKTIKDYINKGHASKHSLEELKLHLTQIYSSSRHKKHKIRKNESSFLCWFSSFLVFLAFYAKFQSTSFNENIFRAPDLLNSLIRVLTGFRKEDFALNGDIEQMFHQIIVR